MKLSVVIPVYNEVHTLREIIERVRQVNIPKEIVLVDDYSTDGTRDLYPELTSLVDKIVLHEKNMGKGAAIRTGVQHVTGDYVIIQDADLEYDPEEYHLLLEPLLQGKADVVYGSRFLGGRAHRVLYFWHMIGNKFLTLLSNMFTNLTLTDMETCYKMVRTDLMKRITIEQNRFGFEPEITAKLAKMRDIHIYEVGISYDGRSYSEGKKIGWRDGFNAIWCILKYSGGRHRDVGKETLKTLEGFDEYADWMYDKVRPYLGKRVLEIGSGIGNYAGNLTSESGREVVLTDCRADYVAILKDKFGSRPGVTVCQFDATSVPPAEVVANPPDTIVCLNVLEHIREDEAALKNMYDALAPGGALVLLVPAHQALYSKIDENLEHYRRYSQKELQIKVRRAGFSVRRSFFFNPVGCVGWWVSGKVLRASRIKATHVKGQSFLMPLARLADRIGLPFGLSVVAIGLKPAETAKPQEHVTLG